MKKPIFTVILPAKSKWGMILPAIIIVLCAFALLFLCRFYPPTAAEEAISWALVGKKVVIDPGHGGTDPGVVGQSGLAEKDINLAVAKDLAELLRMAGAETILTRESDTVLASGKRADLEARAALANQEGVTAFISIHGNSFPSQPRQKGAQVFYGENNQAGENLALAVQNRLAAEPCASERFVLVHKSAFLLQNVQTAAIIVETGFLSNPEDEKNLADAEYRWQLANAIYGGLIDYLAAE